MRRLSLLAPSFLLTLASASTLARPRRGLLPRGLAVRGGSTASDVARYSGAGLALLDSVRHYAYPERVIEAAGAKTSDVCAVFVRAKGTWRTGLTVLLLADTDCISTAALSLYLTAVQAFMGPLHTHEMLKTSKHPVVLYAVLVAAVGALTQCGVVPEWVATFNALFSGFHFYLNPQDSLAFELELPLGLCSACMRYCSLITIQHGVYSGALLAGAARKVAVGAVFATTALHALVSALSGEAKRAGASTHNQLAVAVGWTGLAAMSFA